jgi:uncharacterized protein with von Willebrand factor type A (vWA) domain
VTEKPEFFLWSLFRQLVRRNFAIGLAEYEAVRQALRAGYGWSSRDEFKQVLRALWASSREESVVISALFEQYSIPDWNVAAAQARAIDTPQSETLPIAPTPDTGARPQTAPSQPGLAEQPQPEVMSTGRLPPLSSEEMPRLPFSHVFLPQYPVSYRDVAQTWRRLRWPLREGAATELDVDATVARRSRRGMATPPVLRPRRRNQARVLLVIDRKGSMAPFHGYVDEIRTAIAGAGRLGAVGCFYFHDTPLAGADLEVLGDPALRLPSNLDAFLPQIPELIDGDLYSDPDLLMPEPARNVLSEWSNEAAIVIVSDAGAARRRFDLERLLDTIASLKALLHVSSRLVWLNPISASGWGGSTARQIARHVPMFPMDREGMHRAVNVLRGQPFALERPLAGAARRPREATA